MLQVITEILNTANRSKSKSRNGWCTQYDRRVISIVMYSRSVSQYHGKSGKGFALTSAYQTWKDETQVLQPSVICRANVKTV